MRLAAKLRLRKFDLIVLFSTSTATWLMAQIAGAPVKAGFTDSMNGLLLDIVSPWSPPPCTANNLALVETIGCETQKKNYEGLVSPSEADLQAAQALLNEAGISSDERFLVLAPGTSSGRETKAWSDDGYAEVADRVAEEYGMRSVVVGMGHKSRICELSRSAVDLSGRTSLTVLAGLCAKASVFIGVDSGAMHLAGAVGSPVVALFGPTNPDITGPQGSRSVVVSKNVQCSPCYGHSCENPVCMKDISVSDIMQAVASLEIDRYMYESP
jgi:ADP-heptose:LPS heptosyltransferase